MDVFFLYDLVDSYMEGVVGCYGKYVENWFFVLVFSYVNYVFYGEVEVFMVYEDIKVLGCVFYVYFFFGVVMKL